MQFSEEWLIQTLTILIPLWLSLSVHEFAHAWAAWKLGDDTAALMGRLTLNPIAHIDPVGTLLLPLLGIPFGWAKPVPVNPLCFTQGISMRKGMMLTAIAGPISNLLLALASMIVLIVLLFLHPETNRYVEAGIKIVSMMLGLNVVLAVFNMIPVPPLDGSRVADALMPSAFRPAWDRVCQLGWLPLVALILLPRLTGINLFSWPLHMVAQMIRMILHLLGK